MSLQSSEHVPLKQFIRDEAAPGALWIFLHIPKTAGSSLAHEISGLRAPYRNIHVDYDDQTTSYEVRLDHAVERFISDAKLTRFRSCSGHLTARHVLKIREAQPRSKVFTLLRNPVERVISDFRYARTPAHPPYRHFIAQYPTIDTYVESPVSRNKMFRFLAPNPNMTVPSLLAFLDSFISFVGLTEMYPMSFNILTRLFGMDRLPVSHVRKTEPTKHNRVDVTPDLVRRIQEANSKDIAIYNAVKYRVAVWNREWKAAREDAASRSCWSSARGNLG